MGGDYKQAAAYPSEEQYERWEGQCEELGMRSMSEFMEAMVEAGLKKFDTSGVEPDETNRELRQQRNELKQELDRARDRIGDLEEAVYNSERRDIKEYVAAHPGATYDEIINQLVETVPGRVTTHLEEMEGDDLQVDDEQYYLRDEIAQDVEDV
jgi:ElaB/YqjD/DUF883 family membrane-anchored ribosome-binding protein